MTSRERREVDGQRERGRDREGREGHRHKSFFDWPVAFVKVKLMVANCTLAKCSEEHVNHMKETDRPTDRQTDRQTETQTQRETEREGGLLCPCP